MNAILFVPLALAVLALVWTVMMIVHSVMWELGLIRGVDRAHEVLLPWRWG